MYGYPSVVRLRTTGTMYTAPSSTDARMERLI